MRKIVLLFMLICICPFVQAQTDSITFSKEDMKVLDSMFKSDEFIKLMMTTERKSFLQIYAGGGNRMLSIKNNNANAAELKSGFAFTPGITYNHKSGFGITFNGFFASDSGRFLPYQFSVTPSFQYLNKAINVGFSYTRYFFNQSSHFSPNPYQNEFYANVNLNKPFIQPGLYIGYSNGKLDDTLSILGVTKKYNIKFSDFSLIPYIQHNFDFYKLFSKNDWLTFTPNIMLVAGRQQAQVPELDNKRLMNFPRLQQLLKNRYESDSKFQLQSLATSFVVKYQLKDFFVVPDVYLDYYLHSTTANKFTAVFSLSAGILIQ